MQSDLFSAPATRTPRAARPPAPPDRHFYRCPTCLSVVAVESREAYEKLQCETCDVQIAYMGKMQKQNLVTTYERSVCDARCTGATGPDCDCQCAGANHGSQRTVTVTKIEGKIPQVNPRDPKAPLRRDQYRRAYEDAIDRMAEIYKEGWSDYKEGKRIANRNLWWNIEQDYRRLREIAHGKIHKTRLEKLQAFKPTGKPEPHI